MHLDVAPSRPAMKVTASSAAQSAHAQATVSHVKMEGLVVVACNVMLIIINKQSCIIYCCCCCSVHIRCEEKINLAMTRDGGLESLEVHGLVQLRVNDEKSVNVCVLMDNNDTKGAQVQVQYNTM